MQQKERQKAPESSDCPESGIESLLRVPPSIFAVSSVD
jgi:hypothetical protein